jgi:hypothetical protein
MEFELDCAVKVSNMAEWTVINEKAETAVGRMSDSAGTGFGLRDMQWIFESKSDAEAAELRLASTDLVFEYIGISEMPLEDMKALLDEMKKDEKES